MFRSVEITHSGENPFEFALAMGFSEDLFPVGDLPSLEHHFHTVLSGLGTQVSSPSPLTVSELTLRIKSVLEGGLPPVWVRGEISQFTHHRSGHSYFTLIDEHSQLSCVLWRGRGEGITFLPQVGQMILAFGRVSVYERGGRYQLDCFEIRPLGVGELALAFEALKKKLEAEGLFALERKIGLPSLPEQIGLVTSPEGAALKDILEVARKRAPWVEFRLAGVAVQGVAAPVEISAGIKLLDESGWPQVIVVGRGGGSPEDLWAFNEEKVIRAIAACRTPIVSAVGHEVDVTLADLAADLRAPTPSAAAEMILPDSQALKERLNELESRMRRFLQNSITESQRWLSNHAGVILRERCLYTWRRESQRFDELVKMLETSARIFFEKKRSRLENLKGKHYSLNPLSILSRGYSIVRRFDRDIPVTDSVELSPEDGINITFHRGRAEATVKRCLSE